MDVEVLGWPQPLRIRNRLACALGPLNFTVTPEHVAWARMGA